MPRKNSTSWSVGNGVTSTRMNAINSDFDDLYANGSDRLRLYQLTGDGLLVRIGSGGWRVGSSEGIYAGGTLTVANNTTTYIMIDTAGTIQVSTTGWNGQYARLGRAVASAGTCTLIIDKIDAIGGTLGGAGFNNITSTTYTKGLLTTLIADGVTWTFTYTKRKIQSWTNGSNTWTAIYTNGRLTGSSKT